MKKYKLTDQNLQTYNGFQWEIGVPAPKLSGLGNLCGSGWYHYYHDPLLAVFLNPVHANIKNPIGWEVDAGGIHKDDNGIKGGCTKMTLGRKIELPVVEQNQRVAFAILCAKEVYKNKEWNEWADKWLNGKNRTADVAAYAADAAADAAAYAAADAAAHAAANAANAAANAAAYAADAAAHAADWNYKKLISIAKKAMQY